MAVAVVLLLWLLAWLAMPPLIKWQGQKIASAELGRPVSIGAVDFKPWSLELTVSDLRVAGQPGAPEQLRIARVYVDAAIQSLFRLAPVLDAVQVDAPELRLAHLGDGRYDVDDILARLTAGPAQPEPDKPFPFAVYNIEVKGGRVDFDDRAVGQLHQVRDINLALPFVSSLPSARQVKVQPRLAMVVNGSAFDSQAQALPFDDTRRTEATLQLAAFDLKPYLGYLPAGLPLRLQDATVDADLHLRFQEEPKSSLRLAGTLTVSKLKAVDAQGADALGFDALKLQLADVRPLERMAHLSQVQLDGLRVELSRDASGRLNVLPPVGSKSDEPTAPPAKAKKKPASASAAPAAGAAAQAPLLAIDRLAVQGAAVGWRDASTASDHAQAAALRLDDLQLVATALAYPLDEPLAFSGSAQLRGVLGTDAKTPVAKAPARATPRQRGKPAAPASARTPAGPVKIVFEGKASAQQGEASMHVTDAALALAEPYVAAYLVPRLEGVLDADLGLHWTLPAQSDADPQWIASAKRLKLSRLALSGARGEASKVRQDGDAVPWPSVERLELADVQLDSRTRAVTVEQLDIQRPQALLARDRSGRWMFEPWLRPTGNAPAQAPAVGASGAGAAAGHPAGASTAEPPWSVALRQVTLAGGTLGWRDAQVQPSVRAELARVDLKARGLMWPGSKPMTLDLAAQLGAGPGSQGDAGRLAWRGQLGIAPLAAEGAIDAERLPLHLFEPYFGSALNAQLLRADTGFKGKLTFAETAQGPRARVTGDVRVEELRTYSRPGLAVPGSAPEPAAAGAAGASLASSQAPLAPVVARAGAAGLGEELLSWKRLDLTGLDVQLEPARAPQVTVGGTVLSDFYARLIILPNGRFNLQDVFKPAQPAGAAAPAAAAPAVPASQAASAAGPAARPDPLAPVIRLGPTRLVKGRIDFSDRFIRPNYSARLSELDGMLGAFSSVAPAAAPQMAELALTGRAEGSALLEVGGKINPLAEPLALDIRARMSDLDLPPLSPYAVKYAGHGIERGKLSMDVAYKIQPDGVLTASNKLVLNQLEFGEPVAGAPASLPVKLATALLADSKGVIDLDLPISGSINDPQFSIGPIIFKAIVNLIGRAITAPFTLLARALGGGSDDLSMVPFDPGSARLVTKAREQLDRVAKAMNGRPQLKLTVVGAARLAAEREGLRRERLRALVAAEGRSEAPAAQAAAAPSSAASAAQPAGRAAAGPDAAPALSDERYVELLKRLYRRADIPGRPRNAIGMLRDIPVSEMEKLLMAHIEVGEDAMRQLALQRGVAVKEYLAGQGVAPARLFLGATQTGADAAAPASAASASASAGAAPRPWSPRAELTLGVK